jgi:hypothetical protein
MSQYPYYPPNQSGQGYPQQSAQQQGFYPPPGSSPSQGYAPPQQHMQQQQQQGYPPQQQQLSQPMMPMQQQQQQGPGYPPPVQQQRYMAYPETHPSLQQAHAQTFQGHVEGLSGWNDPPAPKVGEEDPILKTTEHPENLIVTSVTGALDAVKASPVRSFPFFELLRTLLIRQRSSHPEHLHTVRAVPAANGPGHRKAP